MFVRTAHRHALAYVRSYKTSSTRPPPTHRRKAYVEMGKCWTFAGVNNQALKALRAVYKAEENKAVRVRWMRLSRL